MYKTYGGVPLTHNQNHALHSEAKAALPAGDETEIGSKGINISGGQQLGSGSACSENSFHWKAPLLCREGSLEL